MHAHPFERTAYRRETGRAGRVPFLRFLLVILPACAAPLSFAEPYRPSSDQVVLQRLAPRTGADAGELRRLRRAWAADKQHLGTAAALARRHLELARRHGDPRFLGHAQAALAPWWDLATPPAEVLLLRGSLRQSRHQFAAALADIDALLAIDRSNAQGWLTKATIHLVRGEYDRSIASCRELTRRVSALIRGACVAQAASLKGYGQASYAVLKHLVAQADDQPDAIRVWALTALAELAGRLGKPVAAKNFFVQALELIPDDAYLLGAYSDLLLTQHRYAEVVDLLENHIQVDGLLLRMALAETALDPAAAPGRVDTLRARFAANRQRPGGTHWREEARFALSLLADPVRALHHARRNWEEQREPADLRILLEAAVALGDRSAVQDALTWFHRWGLEDVRLTDLVRRLEATAL